MIIYIKLQGCPWCKQTPTVTWKELIGAGRLCWYVECLSEQCSCNPRSNDCAYVKSSWRGNLWLFLWQLERLGNNWNAMNPCDVCTTVPIDLSQFKMPSWESLEEIKAYWPKDGQGNLMFSNDS